MRTEPEHPSPDFDRERHPEGIGLGLGGGLGLGNPNEPTDPAWGDIVGGIWERLTNPIPR
jgi:hypothetical protein